MKSLTSLGLGLMFLSLAALAMHMVQKFRVHRSVESVPAGGGEQAA